MRVFLTGGTGFLGSHVADVLLSEGFEVHALARSEARAELLKSKGARIVLGDLSDDTTVSGIRGVLEKCDAVVHVAGLVKAVSLNDFYRVNVLGTKRIVKAALGARGSRFIHVSSIAAQGPCPGPQPRPPELPEAPLTAYGRSKLESEKEVLKEKALSATIIRPPIIYGPRDYEFTKVFQIASKTGLIPVLNPAQVLSMIHAKDCARAILCALKQDRPPHLIYPVDDGLQHTWIEIAEVLSSSLKRKVRLIRLPKFAAYIGAAAWELWGKIGRTPVVMSRDKVREAEATYWIAGCGLAREGLGFEPSISLMEGVEDTLRWARKEGLL